MGRQGRAGRTEVYLGSYYKYNQKNCRYKMVQNTARDYVCSISRGEIALVLVNIITAILLAEKMA